MAPLRKLASRSGITSSASMCCSSPSPPHSGQAPNGLLKENSRGSISGMVKPDTGQANFSEKIRRRASDAAAAASLVSFLPLAAACSRAACTACSLPRLRGRVGEGAGSCAELCRVPPPCPSPSKRAFTPVFDGLCGGGDDDGKVAEASASSTTANPSASLRHCSSESASRVPISPFTTSRSTTTSMSWVNFLSSGLTSPIS